MTSRIGPIVQAAYLVSNLADAIEQWSAALGLPLFYRIDNVPFESMTYRGQAVQFPLSTAIAYSGDLQIELLLSMPEQEAQFPEFFRTGEGKLHHYQIKTMAGQNLATRQIVGRHGNLLCRCRLTGRQFPRNRRNFGRRPAVYGQVQDTV